MVLSWDEPHKRKYESGLDKGVLYLPDGSAVAWNGLTSIVENYDTSTSPVYYDGITINELITIGSFSATLNAVTYPDQFEQLQGFEEFRSGFLFGGQSHKSFGLCYRTRVGTAINLGEEHYKLHILYNLIAIPSDKTYASEGDDPSLVEFEWTITAVPEEVPGFRPTAHIVIDSSKFDPWLLEDLEERLYGSDSYEAALLPMPDLVQFIKDWYRVKIVDHGDGTWSAISKRPGFIHLKSVSEQLFELTNVNARYLDSDTFEISDTIDIKQTPLISVVDNGNGTWTATTDYDNVIVMISETEFEIRNATVKFQSDTVFRLTDST